MYNMVMHSPIIDGQYSKTLLPNIMCKTRRTILAVNFYTRNYIAQPNISISSSCLNVCCLDFLCECFCLSVQYLVKYCIFFN